MKYLSLVCSLLLSTLLGNHLAHAGIVVGATRLVYPAVEKSVSLNLKNPDDSAYLVQSWLQGPEGETTDLPFIITPPLFRFEAQQDNTLRVIRTSDQLPTDRESLFWLNVKSIGASTNPVNQVSNTLQIAVKTRIKLLYRPTAVAGIPEQAAQTLQWQRQGTRLTVNNPSAFYMNFKEILVGNTPLENVTYVAPKSSTTFVVPREAHGNTVSWRIINDAGGASDSYQSAL
ncbi:MULTISPECIES: molecular chaperone [unclassified Serratia (in: enterobacteria)]|uniref:fimbrial biogenesis chaperone n=1 Tax=unclassified Serratia (in: enterobacteria) TaxID=2647522 RepID=UPI00050774D9|nr:MULTISPECIES: molecular chaperone [unclassified Serratia (in: enterobacteria)]KFK96213.1 long polar fimbrial chaperone LpfB [Serratia sp. Ag2]KFL00630.1 long polar fimbrial chaperone LpfB [Serratia sp. Ag1]